MSWSQSFSPLLLGWPIRPIIIFHHPCNVSASFCRKGPKPPGFEGVEIGLWRWRILCSYAAGTGAKAGVCGWLSRDPQRPGYFEDLNTPASYRFRAPSIGGSKILRVIYIIHPGQFWSTFRDVLRAKLVFLWDKMARRYDDWLSSILGSPRHPYNYDEITHTFYPKFPSMLKRNFLPNKIPN